MTNSSNNNHVNLNNSNSGLSHIQEDEKIFQVLNPYNENSSKNDKIVGMLAYAQYSIYKQEFVRNYRQENGKEPTEEELKSISMSFQNENSNIIRLLKQNSKILLSDYAQEYMENKIREEILEPIEKTIERRTRFWPSIGANVFASFIYSFAVALILFTATVAFPDAPISRAYRILTGENPNHTNPANTKEQK
ncbi:MAG: hypothetical protein MUE44_16050 [Oscillatoriaceae cyanobacterium Prado104]|jgi:hypothetical protein|nr:hypothetical protein [Oscillatoriaceae cyanobacterium Prado104]